MGSGDESHPSIRNGDGRFETRRTARPAGEVMGDLFGERGCVGAVVEPAFLLEIMSAPDTIFRRTKVAGSWRTLRLMDLPLRFDSSPGLRITRQ
jgi:hypothetical protein